MSRYPAGWWLTHLARDLTAELEKAGHCFRHLIRDRDAKFTSASGTVFTQRHRTAETPMVIGLVMA